MLGPWGIWAELWCYTDGLSCPMQPTPANARAPATRWRCSSTPAWLARTVLKGFCFIARKHNTSYYLWINVNTYSLGCLWKCFLTPIHVVSPCLPSCICWPCSSRWQSTACMASFTYSFMSSIFFNLSTPLFWVHSFLCAPFWFTTWTSSLNGFFFVGNYLEYIQCICSTAENRKECVILLFSKNVSKISTKKFKSS